MEFSQYLSRAGLKDAEVAEKIGCDRATVSRIRRGVSKPSAKLIERIYDLTAGKVTANDFFLPTRGERETGTRSASR